jgi:dTDP-glucose 4,6-dehydratase
MTLLITGGASLISDNFVLEWLGASQEPAVNLDKVNYKGNHETLASLQRCACDLLRPR